MGTMVTLRKPPERCTHDTVSVVELLAQVGGKWTIFIIVGLAHGPMRFSEIKRHVDGISQKVLTATLRDLEKDGFVTRTVTPTIPPRVDYELTELGRELCGPLMALSDWAVVNRGRVEAARRAFGAREKQDERRIPYVR